MSIPSALQIVAPIASWALIASGAPSVTSGPVLFATYSSERACYQGGALIVPIGHVFRCLTLDQLRREYPELAK